MTTLCDLSGKIRYATRLDAQAARALWRKQARVRDLQHKKVPTTIYACASCGGFHLTKAERRRVR